MASWQYRWWEMYEENMKNILIENSHLNLMSWPKFYLGEDTLASKFEIQTRIQKFNHLINLLKDKGFFSTSTMEALSTLAQLID